MCSVKMIHRNNQQNQIHTMDAQCAHETVQRLGKYCLFLYEYLKAKEKERKKEEKIKSKRDSSDDHCFTVTSSRSQFHSFT